MITRANLVTNHLLPTLLALAIATNEMLNADAWPGWLLVAPVATWVMWQMGYVRGEKIPK